MLVRKKKFIGILRCFLLFLLVYLIWFIGVRLTSPGRMIRILGENTEESEEVREKRIRIGCFNMAHGRGDEPGGSNWEGGSRQERADRLDQIAELLRDQDLDLLVLNEVDFNCSWSFGVNQAEYLAKACSFPFRCEQRNLDAGIPFLRIAIGNAILSRFPIQEAGCVDYPPVNWWEPILAGKKRGGKVVIVLPDDRELEVGIVHVETRDEEVRKKSVKKLMDELGVFSVLAGDFNSVEKGDGTTAIDQLIQDGRWQKCGHSQNTFPTRGASRRIDWIFTPKEWREIDSKVVGNAFSDHSLVVGEWEIAR